MLVLLSYVHICIVVDTGCAGTHDPPDNYQTTYDSKTKTAVFYSLIDQHFIARLVGVYNPNNIYYLLFVPPGTITRTGTLALQLRTSRKKSRKSVRKVRDCEKNYDPLIYQN